VDARDEVFSQLTATEAETLLKDNPSLSEDTRFFLPCAVRAVRDGVKRAHLISRHTDGALLMELFTHHGIGTMVVREAPDKMRDATLTDVDAILAIIDPLVQQGVLVKRERHSIETDIADYVVLEHEQEIIGCAALHPFASDKAVELACLAVNPFYRDGGRGERILAYAEQRAKASGFNTLFVLSTQTTQWFSARGFMEGDVAGLPAARQAQYNFARKSKVYTKALG
jgi:amino-acid N-acetyltransferase